MFRHPVDRHFGCRQLTQYRPQRDLLYYTNRLNCLYYQWVKQNKTEKKTGFFNGTDDLWHTAITKKPLKSQVFKNTLSLVWDEWSAAAIYQARAMWIGRVKVEKVGESRTWPNLNNILKSNYILTLDNEVYSFVSSLAFIYLPSSVFVSWCK